MAIRPQPVLAALAAMHIGGCAAGVAGIEPPIAALPACTSAMGGFVSVVHSDGGNDKIYGSGRLFGESDRDTILGGSADDEIHGGLDADVLMGGAGADRFGYEEIRDSAADKWGRWSTTTGDVILDFSPAQGDEIDLTSLGRTHPGGGTFYNWSGTKARPWSVWIDESFGDTFVLVETTGDSTADLAIRLVGTMRLTPNDFCGVAAALKKSRLV